MCGTSSGLDTQNGLLTRATDVCCGDTTGAAYEDSFSGTCEWTETDQVMTPATWTTTTDCSSVVCQGQPTVAPTVSSAPTAPTPAPTFCISTDNGAQDTYNDGCLDWYGYIYGYSSSCGSAGVPGNYDDDDFTAFDMCCGCGGGMASVTALPTYSPTQATYWWGCENTAGLTNATNAYGYTCSWYLSLIHI